MLGSYASCQQPNMISPYYFNFNPYYVQQGTVYQQMPQNASNYVFSIPFQGGFQYFTPSQQQQLSQLFFNNQCQVLASNYPSSSQINVTENAQQSQNNEQNFVDNQYMANQIQQAMSQTIQNNNKIENLQVNQDTETKQLIKKDSSISNQQQSSQENNININQAHSCNISQSNISNTQHFSNLILQEKNSAFKDSCEQFQQQQIDSPLSRSTHFKGIRLSIHTDEPSTKNAENCKSSNLIDEGSTSLCMNENNKSSTTELKIQSQQNSSRFIIFKEKKTSSQDNLFSLQNNSDINQKSLSLDDNKLSEQSLDEENLLESEEASQNQNNITKEKQLYNKSRNFSKNLLKSFFKYTQKANSENKRFLFNFKRYISSNKTNNELIIKLLTNSPYHSYFIEFLGQPATDWIVNSKVQNMQEQLKFLELCRSGSVSDLKKRSHHKKKSLFTLKKQ
ncbi:hypothetical protein TTHERM_00340100 (macronuclear) [Tetrahymena thermophila SB210]|uniref:Uncharacterized protein n=1 Tax=Tetrahymena thermophila (strain SB210) TaxID=312017 RepID=I7M1R9_TETTS|nr:hypothetical protein TTHERM_00340100 [Tetrahymena thermophila SB210]EAR97429.1 hypothetical protein TTHERM_00340100 [Tetrahymena thermophila SB210]|eukprot:XP_001017674.1 hypothetical protein TTHERM_00340100 [Tetrahymena thermophila SB210]